MFPSLLLSVALTVTPPVFDRSVALPAGKEFSPVSVRAERAVLEGRGQLVVIPRTGQVQWVPAQVTVDEANRTQFRGTQVLPSGEIQSVRLDFRACQAQVWRAGARYDWVALKGDFRKTLACGQDTEYVFTPSFHPSGQRVVTADPSGLRVWQTSTGNLLRAQKGKFFNVVHRPDGSHVVAVSSHARGLQLELWRSDLTRRIAALPLPAPCLRGMMPDLAVGEEQVAFSCRDEVRVWNWREGRVNFLKRSGQSQDFDAAPVMYGRYIAVSESNAGATLWDTRTGERLVQTQVPEKVQVTDVAFAPGGFMAVALSNGSVQTYDAEKQGKYLRTQQVFGDTGKDQFLRVRFSEKWGQMLVVTDQEARIIELPRG